MICLRFGRVVDTAEIHAQPADPCWLHVDDAVSGVRQALACRRPGWSAFHITAAGKQTKVRLGRAAEASFGYTPAHDLMAGSRSNAPGAVSHGHGPLAPTAPVASRPIRRVVIFGAGGPMGAAVAAELAAHYQLRLTDVRPLAEIAAEGPQPNQNPGSPVPVVLGPPHESRVVDVTNPDDVLAACADMDAIVNCTVIRVHPVNAFRVNTLGAYNIAHAAAALGIRRLVQTGPQLISLHGDGDYSSDYDIPADVPPRPDRHLYGHSKYLGQEILRVFADYYDLEAPVPLFSNLSRWGREICIPCTPSRSPGPTLGGRSAGRWRRPPCHHPTRCCIFAPICRTAWSPTAEPSKYWVGRRSTTWPGCGPNYERNGARKELDV
jgi:nucleoside-diphosphate-sugar epimerase